MSCTKQLTISDGTCDLINCSTKDPVWVVGHTEEPGIAYSQDYCYCLVIVLDPTYTFAYFNKYNSATNALDLKQTVTDYIVSGVVYDSVHKKFVCASATTVYVFDPVTETLATFATGADINSLDFIYVSQKQKTYGWFNVSGQAKMGVIDLSSNTCTMLGNITNNWNNLAYSPVVDMIYGIVGAGALNKFNLATNTEIAVGLVDGIGCCWDSDQNVLVCFGAKVTTVDTSTDAITVRNNHDWDYSVRWFPFYVSTFKKCFVTGYDALGEKRLYSYDTQTFVVAPVFYDWGYYGAFEMVDGSVMAAIYDPDLGGDGIRKICLPDTDLRFVYWTMEETLLADRVDSVIALPAAAVSSSQKNPVVTPTGGIGIDAGTGVYGNGFRIAKGLTTTLSNIGWIGPYYTTSRLLVTNSSLRQDGNGFSFCFWLKVNSLNTLPAYIEYTKSGFFRVNLKFTDTYAKCQANTGLSNSEEIVLPIPTVGVWTFYECYHDAVTDKMGVVINNSTDYPASFTPAILATADGTFTIVTNTTEGKEPYNSTFDATNSQDFIVDEVLIRMDARLTVAQRAYLYNAGAGRTWPIVLP